MKTFALVLALSLAASSCKQLEVHWPTAVKCLAAPSAAVVERVRVIVEEDGLDAVFSAKTVAALEDLARQYGPEVIVCILRDLIDAYTAPTGMQAPPERLAAARRSQAFLNEHDLAP
jgi:hypothetical protein